MKCYECKWLDRSVVLTSSPPRYGCTLGFGAHYADHECEYDFMPIVRCKDCKNAGRKMGTHYHCEQQMSWHKEEYFCSYGERREP